MPIEQPERSPWELSDTEALSRAVAKINWQRVQELESENKEIKNQLRELGIQLNRERTLRVKYETHYAGAVAPLIILPLICSLVAGLVSIAPSRPFQIVLGLVFFGCIGAIIRLCSFKPGGD
jgi:lipopolysaccharide export LptBFGC system permease protein LptF